jgi:hypothetical protein
VCCRCYSPQYQAVGAVGVLLCVLQWFERALDLVGLAAGAINIYVSKVRARVGWVHGRAGRGLLRCRRNSPLLTVLLEGGDLP